MKHKKNIINSVLICLILSIIFYIILETTKEEKIKNKEEVKTKEYYIQQAENEERQNLEEANKEKLEENKFSEKEYPKEEVISEYKGYPVIAKLKIPKIELETYILESYSESALNVSVTKLWGSDPNEIGNFCVIGHNFIRKNMFHNLKKLNIGDRFFISDNKIGIVEYEIYDLYKVLPEDISVLAGENLDKQVTLITCTNDSKKRIIVKAKEV